EACPEIAPKTMRQAIIQIIVADVSMSLDNVLAVAGAAAQHTAVLMIGLLLSVALMGVAAGLIAGILRRHHWIAHVGLAIILGVGLVYDQARKQGVRGKGDRVRPPLHPAAPGLVDVGGNTSSFATAS